MRKCPGVRAVRSSGSTERADSSRELRMVSICINRVDNSSNVMEVQI